MLASEALSQIERYLDEVELAIEGKADWPTYTPLVDEVLIGSNAKTKLRLKELERRNSEVVAKIEQRKKDLNLLLKRVSKRDASGPIAVDIRA